MNTTVDALTIYHGITASSVPPPPLQPFIDVPDILSVHFTGRTDELDYIKEIFDAISDDLPIRCVIHGMHGIGKSQLTLYFAISSFKQRRYMYVFWISATTIAKLHQGYDKLLDLVDHRDRDHSNQQTRLTAARRWLEQCESKWLLVLDNVERDTLDFLQKHLPGLGKHGNILFTTRTKSLADSLANSGGQRHRVLALRIPNEQDAAKLLLDHYEGEMDDGQMSKAQDIVNSVGRLPLAVAQAGSFINQTGKSLDEMLKLYESNRKFEMISWENDLSTYEAKSVAATFSCQLQDLAVRYPIASNLLHILSFLDPESIPLNMIVQGAEKMELPSAQTPDMPDFTPVLDLIRSPIELHKAVTQLENRSLVQRQPDSGVSKLYIHDLVQFMIRADVKRRGAEDHWFDLSVQLVYEAFATIESPKLPSCWPDYEACLPHIRSLSVRQDMCDRETWSLLMNANEGVAYYLNNRGRYDESEKFLNQALAWKETRFGSEDINTMRTLGSLGIVYFWRGRYDEARIMFGRVLACFEIQLGIEHPHTLSTMNNLAMAYQSQGHYNAAEIMLGRVLAEQEKHLGVEHPHTLTTMNNLGMAYQAQGQYDSAEKMYKRVVTAQEKHLGVDYPHTFTTMNNLAMTYHSQGQYDAAETMFKRVLAAQEKHLGVEHPNTLGTMHCLANLYQYQGRYDAAETIHKQVLTARKKHLGVDHPDTLGTINDLAEVWQSQGDDDAAEIMLGQVLTAREKYLGVDHPDTLCTVDNLGMVYQGQNRLGDAETMHERALAGREERLGADHPDTLSTMNNLGMLYEAQNRLGDAETMYERALAGREKRLGVDHPRTLNSLRNLSRLYRARGRLVDAEMLASRAGSHSLTVC